MAHALLSPSSASRWMACTPSARLESQFADRESEAAAEGTAAHELGEALLRIYAGEIKNEAFEKLITSEIVAPYYCEAMRDYADDYASFVIERFGQAKAITPDAVLKIEQRLDMTDYVPDGFGTGDAVIIADGTMDVIDLKYGKGVPVYSENNKQMMLYALGALREFDYMYDIQKVRMTIYQPRLDNISTWEIAVSDLKNWAETELKPRAALAFKGEGELATGDHCRFCRALALCRAQADRNMELAKQEFESCDLIDDDRLVEIIAASSSIKAWLSAVETHALKEAIDNGKQWPGYKLVEGRSNRMYSNQDAVADKLKEQGYDEDDIYDRSILGVTAMEKLLTKKGFDILLGDLIIKPQGKPTLVPSSDKRAAWNSTESAINDFSNIQI